MNSQPLAPHTADSTADEVTSTAARPAISPEVSPAAAGQPSAAPGPVLSLPGGSSAPKAGIRTTQFWLLAGVLALAAWMVFAGKLDAGWFAALAPAAALVYQIVRENLYRDASTHPHDALNQLLETILGQIPAPTSADATALIAALKGGNPVAALSPASPSSQPPAIGVETTPLQQPPGSGPGVAPHPNSQLPSPISAAVAVIAALLLLPLLPGCSMAPYYVSGINGTVDTSKDGARLTGGEVGVTISPNPNYPLPHSTSGGQASSTGLAK